MESFTVLHLSDLHYLERDHWHAAKVLEDLKQDCREAISLGLNPDAIFFTGDLAYGHVPTLAGGQIQEQFTKGLELLDSIRSMFSPAVPWNRVFLVPGNHDVNRANFAHGMYGWMDKLAGKDGDAMRAPVTACIRDADNNFVYSMTRLEDYRKALQAAGLKHLLQDPARLTYACRLAGFQDKIGIVGFNSAWTSSRPDLPQGRKEQGILLMGGEWQLKSLYDHVRDCPVKIALIHHPSSWLHESESVSFGTMLQARFSFVFHGHEHVLRLQPSGNHLTVSGGACHTATSDPKAYNFVRVGLSDGSVEVWRRIYDDRGVGKWKPDTFDGFDEHGHIRYPGLLKVQASSPSPKPKRAAPSGAKKGSIRTGPQPALATNGLIICCDLNEFSAEDLMRQQALIKRLWESVLSSPLYKLHQGHKRAFAGEAADGLVVGFLDSVAPKEAIALAARLSKAIAAAKHAPGLRLGLHYGVFVSIQVSGNRSVLTGTGINECAKVTSYGGSVGMILSERFVDVMRQTLELESSWFEPSLDHSPIDVFGRSAGDLGIRLYRGKNVADEHKNYIPNRFKNLVAVNDRIRGVLEVVEGLTQRLLVKATGDNTITEATLAARISIFAKRKAARKQFLCPMARYSRANRHAMLTGTRYPLDASTNRPLNKEDESPLVRAFKYAECVCVSGLPKWSADPQDQERYFAAAEAAKFDRDLVRGWSCRSRSILIFPFGLFDFGRGSGQESTEPDGLICIDTELPLNGISDEVLRTQVLGVLQQETTLHLPVIWALRTRS